MASSNHRIRIHAKPQVIFQAISTKEGTKGWYTSNVEGAFTEGGTSLFHFPNGETFEWKTMKLVPEKEVERECSAGPGAAKGTKVVWKVEAIGEAEAVVHLEHTGWPDGHDALATCNTLWGILLGNLRKYAETGQLVPEYR